MSRFIASSCIVADVELEVFLKNNFRDGDSKEITDVKKQGMNVDIFIISSGEILAHYLMDCTVSYGEIKKYHQGHFKELKNIQSEFSLMFFCYFDNYHGYVSQEHQLCYKSANGDKYSTVLYDQYPDLAPRKNIQPIVLMAPKAWVSSEINTYLIMTNINETKIGEASKYPFEINILNSNGKVLISKSITIFNSTYIFNISEQLRSENIFPDGSELFVVTAKGGGDGSAVITTLIKDISTGCMALEHSLAPFYYFTGDFSKIRNEALDFK